MNWRADALIFVTLVIEMFTTEGSTRSVISAIDSEPTRFSSGFGKTVTGVAVPRVSAAISGWGEPPDLAQPAAATSEKAVIEDTLSAAVERNLTRYFGSFDNGLPPPGLYHRILREVEYPLLSAALAATRGNQIRAADLLGLNRNTLRKKIRDLDIQVFRSGG